MDPYHIDVADDQVSAIHTPGCITLCALGRPIMVRSSDARRYANVLDLLRQRRFADAFVQANPETPTWVIAARSMNIDGVTVVIEKDAVLVNGVRQPPLVINYIDQLIVAGLDISNVLALLARLEKNPSFNARHELLGYLISRKLPITEDGHFLAYKSVKEDLWDRYTGETFYHAIGAELKMDRRDVDDNPNHDCSSGAHFADYEYMRHYDRDKGVICVLKVDPADVVTIADGGSKGRACRYVVVGHFTDGRDAAREVVEVDYPAAPQVHVFVNPASHQPTVQIEVLDVVPEDNEPISEDEIELEDDRDPPEDEFLDGTYEGE